MKKIFVVPILFLGWCALTAQTFRFTQEEGQKYRIVSEMTQGLFFNEELLGQSITLNKIAVSIEKADREGALLEARYEISEQYADTGIYISSEQEQFQYRRSHRGEYSGIPADQMLPSVRNIPVFPEGPIGIGDSWSSMGEEVYDLYPFFRIDHRIHIPFRVFYTYTGTESFEGRVVDVFQITYHYWLDLSGGVLPLEALAEAGSDLPLSVAGDFKQIYRWDREAGIPAAAEDEFRILWEMASGNRYIYQGFSEGEVIEADQWEKESVREQIEEAIEKERLEDVSVSVGDEGVTLTLEDIHFYPDTARLLPGEERKLAELGRIVKDLPGHDLLITGHTADVGSRSSGQELSERRASAVASFLLKRGVRSSSEMIIRGMGARQPVADNSSEAGRKRNRRVEITILDN